MLTNRQVYRSFEACKKIYGSNEIHVQFIAIQLGVLAKDVIEYIEANSNLVTTRVSNVPIGINYSGVLVLAVTQLPYMTISSIINEGDVGGNLVLSVVGDTFVESNASPSTKWSVGVGTTGLTFTVGTAVTGTTTKTLAFTGTAKAGTISIQCLNAGLTGSADSDILYFEIAESEFDYTAVKGSL